MNQEMMNGQNIIDLLPHKYPMLMIEKIIAIDDQKSVTRNKIQPSNPFMNEKGELSDFAYIELMAQTAATFLVRYYYQRGHQETALGYVIGISSLEFMHSLKQGQEVEITASLTHSIDNYHVFKVDAMAGNQLSASGELKIYAQV